MATEIDVLIRIRNVIRGITPLEDFEAWFTEETWDTHPDGYPPLIREVTGLLAESAGAVGDDVVIRQLRAFVDDTIKGASGARSVDMVISSGTAATVSTGGSDIGLIEREDRYPVPA